MSKVSDPVQIWDPAATASQPVTLTPAALAHVAKRIMTRGVGVGLRLGVKQSGCNGLKYVVDYVDAANPDDIVFPADARIAVYVAASDLAYLAGTVIDFVRSGLNESFTFSNPNQQGACGCGESFNVDKP
jgi:iron-sulfur cluster assembly protein